MQVYRLVSVSVLVPMANLILSNDSNSFLFSTNQAAMPFNHSLAKTTPIFDIVEMTGRMSACFNGGLVADAVAVLMSSRH